MWFYVKEGLTALTLVIAGTAWAVRLEGRVNGQDKILTLLQKTEDDRHADVKESLQRIESKVDKLNGRY